MRVVVERGTARCPRCMAAADYSFREASDRSLRYTVTCRQCSHVHTELCAANAPDNDVAA